MAFTQVNIPITVNGKSLNYKPYQFYSSDYAEQSIRSGAWGPQGFFSDRYLENTNYTEYKNYPVTSLFEFLDLPKTVASYTGTFA